MLCVCAYLCARVCVCACAMRLLTSRVHEIGLCTMGEAENSGGRSACVQGAVRVAGGVGYTCLQGERACR